MAEAEKKLLDRFYQEFWIFLILMVAVVITTVVLITFYFMKCRGMSIKIKVGTQIICVLFVALSCFFAMFFLKYHNDYVYLKTSSPVVVEGKVIGYSRVISGDDLTVTKSWPIIVVDETKEELSLNVIKSEEKTQIDEVYVFVYLPNTKIAEIINNN